MGSLFSTMFAALKAKATSLWTKIKLYTSLSYIRSKLITKIKTFFSKLFSVKPKDKNDYYSVFAWLISKKLAFAIVIIIGLLGVWYISTMMPEDIFAGDGSLKTYKHNAFALKFHSGDVRILADSGYVAYVGNVEENEVTGLGKLYGAEGNLIYEGSFDNNYFNGEGKMYYKDGTLKYSGGFSDNIFHGTGNYFYPNGIVNYTGEYEFGIKSGQGELFNTSGNTVYLGLFRYDDIVYDELLGKATTDVNGIYKGISRIYMTDNETMVDLSEIDAMYYIPAASNSLDGTYPVNQLIIRRNFFNAGAKKVSSITELAGYFGEVTYEGYTYALPAEALTISKLGDTVKVNYPDAGIKLGASSFDEVYNMSSYNKQLELFIHTFESEGILYSFYSYDENNQFEFYSMELVN